MVIDSDVIGENHNLKEFDVRAVTLAVAIHILFMTKGVQVVNKIKIS